MAKKKQPSAKNVRLLQRMILSTTSLLLGGLAIVLIGWTLDGNIGLYLIGFGSALLFISAILFWSAITE